MQLKYRFKFNSLVRKEKTEKKEKKNVENNIGIVVCVSLQNHIKFIAMK